MLLVLYCVDIGLMVVLLLVGYYGWLIGEMMNWVFWLLMNMRLLFLNDFSGLMLSVLVSEVMNDVMLGMVILILVVLWRLVVGLNFLVVLLL